MQYAKTTLSSYEIGVIIIRGSYTMLITPKDSENNDLFLSYEKI